MINKQESKLFYGLPQGLNQYLNKLIEENKEIVQVIGVREGEWIVIVKQL